MIKRYAKISHAQIIGTKTRVVNTLLCMYVRTYFKSKDGLKFFVSSYHDNLLYLGDYCNDL